MDNVKVPVKHKHFISSIYELQTHFDYSSELRHIENLKWINKDQLTTFMEDEKNILNKEIFKSLKYHICGYLETFTKDILKLNSFYLDDSWFQAYEKDSFHDMHIHGKGKNEYSLIFYLQVTDNSSSTKFANPGYPYIETDKYYVKPEKGKLVIFNSSIPHSVPPNKDEERIILSANFMVR